MAIQKEVKANIRKSIERTRKANLTTTVVLEACCYIDNLGKKLFTGGSEYRFKKYMEMHMPATFGALKQRSNLLGKKDDFCLQALWHDIRCGLVHEIDPKSRSVIIGTGRGPVHLTINDNRFPRTKIDLDLSSPRFNDDFLKSLAGI
ncbi:MAG: hypothetical protein JSW27_05865 [Phycisphaerales bacterium]|nr:MAG: hypothetical protein JSW27_05865 [Phycisphaerales bacterium]